MQEQTSDSVQTEQTNQPFKRQEKLIQPENDLYAAGQGNLKHAEQSIIPALNSKKLTFEEQLQKFDEQIQR